jgi:F-type H+-transporting ATPase subunit gamma
MESLESLRRRIESAQDLHGIVRTMKALAAANIRQYERAVEAVGVYYRTVDAGLGIALQDQIAPLEELNPKRIGRLGAIIFGTDQGMCGQFNEQIVAFALDDLRKNRGGTSDSLLLVIGIRAAARIEEAKREFQDVLSVPSSVGGIAGLVQSILLRVNTWRESGQVDRVMLYNNLPTSGSSYQPSGIQLIPVDISRFKKPVQERCTSRSLPMFTMERGQLLAALIRQYLFVQLYRACAESLASENTSRLMTMQSAEKNIEERLGELNTSYHSRRQEAITSELLDVVSGFEVVSQ